MSSKSLLFAAVLAGVFLSGFAFAQELPVAAQRKEQAAQKTRVGERRPALFDRGNNGCEIVVE